MNGGVAAAEMSETPMLRRRDWYQTENPAVFRCLGDIAAAESSANLVQLGHVLVQQIGPPRLVKISKSHFDLGDVFTFMHPLDSLLIGHCSLRMKSFDQRFGSGPPYMSFVVSGQSLWKSLDFSKA
jgi:hypothetical protein